MSTLTTVPLTINSDLIIMAQVQFGGSSQTFQMQMDTGSAYIWVLDSNSQDCAPPLNCFTPGPSFTNLHQSTTLPYGAMTVMGNLGEDTLTIGGVDVKYVEFFTVTQEQANTAT